MSTVYAEAPFLSVQSFTPEEQETAVVPVGALTSNGAVASNGSFGASPAPSWSPFLTVYESPGGGDLADERLRGAYASLVNDLYDEEFDDALFELLTSARGLHQDQISAGRSRSEADRMVTQHFSRLAQESDRMLDAMTRELSTRDVAAVEGEVDTFAERYAPATALEPEFEEFLGKLVKKIGKGVRAVAKTAVKSAVSLGLGPVLNRIKALVRPLLNQVLQKAIGRLPQSLQPAARTLAERLGFKPKAAPAAAPARSSSNGTGVGAHPGTGLTDGVGSPAGDAIAAGAGSRDGVAGVDGVGAASANGASSAGGATMDDDQADAADAGSSVQSTAGPDIPAMQQEFDDLLAEAMLSEDELEWEWTRARVNAAAEAAPVFAELDDARERFIQQLRALKEGENPAPHVEGFIPAVLPALKIATRLIGRPRVVNFLSGLLGKLIANLVGPNNAPALSRAIVDAGMKLVSLEATDDEAERIGHSAIAATVEEAVTRIASLPDHVLENEDLLEGFALEAFEQAAAANLPAVFPDTTYKRRPELLEGGVNATWAMLPIGRPRYKRCSQTFTVTIAPHAAEAIEGFEDAPLSEYFTDRLGLPEGETVEAEVHLFEVLPGGTAEDIARGERETPGLGSADEAVVEQLQPLTPSAAGVLLGKPALGRAVHPGSTVRSLAPGQRVYHLALGRRPLTMNSSMGRRKARKLARVHVTLDVPADVLRVSVFLSEVKAQRLAVRLRQQAHVGSLTVGFHKLLRRRLPHILHGRRPHRLRVVHPSVLPGAAATAVLGRLPGLVPQAFILKMQEWLTTAFAEFSRTQAQAYLTAAESPEDGVTLVFSIASPPGLAGIGRLLAQSGANATDVLNAVTAAPAPKVQVTARSGYHRD